MLGTRYDAYTNTDSLLPFVLYVGIERTPLIYSKEKNWHEELELELCESGEGELLLNGEKLPFTQNDIAVINPNVIHYTAAKTYLRYTCLIINTDFARQAGIDCSALRFSPLLRSEALVRLINELKDIYSTTALPFRTAKLHTVLLRILTELAENHSQENNIPHSSGKAFENVKTTIRYIRDNYAQKISLDTLSRAVCADKYTLCRDFKRLSGQTIVEYLNTYRCQRAADFISDGATVAEAAHASGFENLSFFTKTFKKNMGVLPSSYKKQ